MAGRAGGRPRFATAGAMGERLRGQPGVPSATAATAGAAATPTCSLQNGLLLLQNGFHPLPSNGDGPRPLLLRHDQPLPAAAAAATTSHGSPAKKCRTRRRMDSGRKNRPRK